MFFINLLHSYINKIKYFKLLKWGEKLGRLGYIIHELGNTRKTIHQAMGSALLMNPDSEKIDKMVKKYFIHLGTTLMEILRFDRLNNDWRKHIIVENQHYFNQTLKKGKGVILLSAHLGNWELLISGLPLLAQDNNTYAIVWKQPQNKYNIMLDKQRSLWGTRLLYSQEIDDKQIEEILSNNGIILIMGDRYDIGKTKVDFFGYKTGVAAGPFLYAQKYGSPLLPVYTVRQKVGHKIIFTPPYDLKPLIEKQEIIKNYLQKSIIMIENWIRLYPEQWMWIFKRWEWK